MAGYGDIDPGAVVLPHGIERRARAVRELGFRAAGEHGGHPARPDGHRPMSHEVDAAMKPLPMAPMDLRPSRHARHAERLELPESRDPLLAARKVPQPRRQGSLHTFRCTM